MFLAVLPDSGIHTLPPYRKRDLYGHSANGHLRGQDSTHVAYKGVEDVRQVTRARRCSRCGGAEDLTNEVVRYVEVTALNPCRKASVGAVGAEQSKRDLPLKTAAATTSGVAPLSASSILSVILGFVRFSRS